MKQPKPQQSAGSGDDEDFSVLLGRRVEREALTRLLTEARAGNGGALLIHGEPGIGKSALLDYAVDSATKFQVLRAVGNETENELPYAGAHQLCGFPRSAVELLPTPQREALGVAFGHLEGQIPDRLFVGLALLNLLIALSAEEPVLCIIEDAQWLDRESARALAIAARRLGSERIAMVFACRAVPAEFEDLPHLAVAGLELDDARRLLNGALSGPFDDHVLERILAEARGNPLALLELPNGLRPAELGGGFALPIASPLVGRIEASFRRRIGMLPPTSQRLLLIAAAEATGDPGLVWRAAQLLDVDESAAIAVADDGLLEMSPRVLFRHSLVRSAVYGAASPAERRKVHGALAAATDGSADPDRRVWHLAHAAWHPDDEVATALEVSASRAAARGGLAAAAAFLERAAELTVDSKRRVARTFAAAEAKRRAGDGEAALALASLAEHGPMDEIQSAQFEALRARISFESARGRDAPDLLLAAAKHLDAHDPTGARETYLDALTAALFAGSLTNGAHARDVAKAILGAPPAEIPRASDELLRGLALLVVEGPAVGTETVKRAIRRFRDDAIEDDEQMRWSWLAGRTACFIWDYDSWDLFTRRQIELAHSTGALSNLPLTLSTSAGVQLFAGRLGAAQELVEQVEMVADVIDAPTAGYAAVLLAAIRGYKQEASELINASASDFAARGEGMGVTLTRCAAAVLSNGLARYDEAYIAAWEALEDPEELWFWPWAAVELVEAASRTGNAEAARPVFDRLTEGTSASGTVWALAIEERCRALLSEGAAAEELYRSALERLNPTVLRLDLARTRLLFGEWLRRENRPADAREQLRAAHGLFTEFGSASYAERARIELAATGERVKKVDTGGRLTPQELRAAELASRGATNSEIASQMFLSLSTVEYHLHKVFRKLHVKSRTQLARRMFELSDQADDSYLTT